MRERLLLFLLLMVGALLQQFLPVWPIFGGIKPPVLASLALYYALRRDRRDMWLAIFSAAVLQDGLDLGSFGPALLAFPVFGIVANRIRDNIFAEGLVTQIVFGGLMGLFVTLVTILIYGITGQRPMHFGYNLLRLFGAIVLGATSLPLVSLGMKKLEASLPKRRRYGWQ